MTMAFGGDPMLADYVISAIDKPRGKYRKGRLMFDRDKLERLVHYICYRVEPKNLGAVKLNKVLWYSEALAYLRQSESITGEKYVKRQHGPVAYHLPQVIDSLTARGAIAVRDSIVGDFSKKEYVYLLTPDITDFTPESISLVESVMEFVCCKHSARSISELSHTKVWELAELGEEIPMFALHALRKTEITEADVAWAKRSLEMVA
jgi:hypothetical protein